MDGRSIKHLPGLDGLRGLAVVAVVAYHFGLPGAKGGFLGVDVFFVVSGFLVTKILADELSASGRIDVRSFWIRRVRRLVPALVALLAGIGAVYGFRVPEKLAAGRLDLAASAVFMSNWRMIASSTSYFDRLGRPPLTRHLWSLAIEGQFYAIWPVVLLGVAAVTGRERRRMAVITVLMGAISAAWCAVAYRPGVDPSRVYFGSDTRLVAVLLGAGLALWIGADATPLSRGRMVVSSAAGLAALAVLGLTAGTVGDQDAFLYRGSFALVAVLAAAAVWAATRPGSIAERTLSFGPLTWLGVRSYSLYLWHWPVVALTQPGIDVPVGINRWALAGLRLVLSLALTEVSYRCIELPFRRRSLERWWASLAGRPGAPNRSPLWFFGTVATALVLTAGAAGVSRAALNDGIADSLSNPTDELVVRDDVAAPPVTVGGNVGSTVAPAVTPTAPPPAPAVPIPAVAVTTNAIPTSAVPTTFPLPPPDPRQPNTTMNSAEAVATAIAEATAPRPPAVLAIGDSIMKGAAPALRDRLGNGSVIDAAISRPFIEGVKVFRTQTAKHPPFGAVVIHLGNNGVPTRKQFAALVDAIGPKIPVLFINMRETREWAPKLNALLREETKVYPNMRILEWNKAAGGRTYLFGKDKLHLSGTGGRYYSELIVWALAQAGYVGTAPNATPVPNVVTTAPTRTSTVTTAAPNPSVPPQLPATTRDPR